MPMRILCCSGSMESGGSERQLWQLAVGLPAEHIEVQIYLIYRRGKYLSQIPARIAVHDFSSQQLESGPRYPGSIHRQQVKHLTKILREQQIDLVYDRTFHMTLVTAAACRATGTPRVSVIVNPPSSDFVRSQERFGWLKKRLLARAYRDPRSRCLAVSNSVAEDAASFYQIPKTCIEAIPSPIDIATVEQAAQADPTAVPDRDTTFRWLIVGRLAEQKGQRLAIEAMAKLKAMRPNQPIELTLIGDGPLRESLVERAKQLNLQSTVRFEGQLDNPYPWMQATDLLCIPSWYEGLPNVALEGMCLNTPIVASDCSGSVRELLGDGRGCVVPVGDVDALAHAVLDRIEQPQRWQARASAARNWVTERHRLQPWLSHMQQLFEELKS
ncbi:MAG: glycosyltransferase [Planctomycetales bacterium]|nr:glycosyltransferase [Planctomycetales bacterium]